MSGISERTPTKERLAARPGHIASPARQRTLGGA